MNDASATLRTIWPAIESAAIDAGAIRVGACDLTDDHVRNFETWLGENLEAEMAYLRRNLAIRKNPAGRFARGRSAIVILVPYPSERPLPRPENIAAHITRYAQGDASNIGFTRSLWEVDWPIWRG